MSNSLQATLSNPVAGLGDFTFTIVDAGDYTVRINSTIPLNSALVIEVKLNSTSQFVSPDLPTPTQQSMGGGCTMECAAGDVVHVILTSSADPDNLPNGVKSVINLYQGF